MRSLIVVAVSAALMLSCTEGAVRGFESGGGWSVKAQHNSGVQYNDGLGALYSGASEDGTMISFSYPDGTTRWYSKR